jgi:cytochrome c
MNRLSRFRFATATLTALVLLSGKLSAQLSNPTVRGHGGPIRALAVLADGRVASAGFDGAVIVWDVKSGRPEHFLRFHSSAVNALLVRRDGCLLSGGEDGKIVQWCQGSTAPSAVPSGHASSVSSLALAPNGRDIASGDWDGMIRLSATSPEESPRQVHKAPVTALAYGHVIEPVTAGALAPLLSASYDGVVRLEGNASSTTRHTLQLPSPVNGVTALRNGHFLLACADGILREVNHRLERVRDIALPDGPLTTVAVSSDQKSIATAGMRTPVTLIDMQSGRVMARIVAPGLPIWSMAFSMDSLELYTGGADGALRRFDVASGRALGDVMTAAAKPELPNAKHRGAQVFRACIACHSVTERQSNLAGPTLAGLIGRPIASVPGYQYSDPFKAMTIVWTAETIDRLFEVGPALFTPGTKMPEQRIIDPDDRKALIEWLSLVTTP